MYALIVLDADGGTVVRHVAWDTSESLYVDHEEVRQREWGKASSFLEWVRKNHPEWTIFETDFDIEIREGELVFCKV